LQPTYRLLMGLPGRSNALAIAKRLGIRDEIIEDAREMIDPDNLRTEDLLDEIHRQLDGTRREHSQVENLRTELEAEKQALEDRLEKIEYERLAILEEAREESRQELEALRLELAAIKRQSTQAVGKAKTAKNAKVSKAVAQQIRDLEEKVTQPLEKQDFSSQQPRPLRDGDRVYVRNLKTDGTVLDIGEDNVDVLIGKMRVKVDLRNIERPKKSGLIAKSEKPPSKARSDTPKTKVPSQPSPTMELHLRGMRGEDALDRLGDYLDEAYAAGMPFVRIVHGKGTGILRQLVRQALSESSLVSRWEKAMDNEGGEGVTIAYFDAG
jgi:DNA mismatch repair protein MutS2